MKKKVTAFWKNIRPGQCQPYIWKTTIALTHEVISTCQRCEYEMPQLDRYVTQQQFYVTEMSHSALIAWATFAH